MSNRGNWMAKAEVIVIGAALALAAIAYVVSRAAG
jgi:hypothetical protein